MGIQSVVCHYVMSATRKRSCKFWILDIIISEKCAYIIFCILAPAMQITVVDN